jgi:O-antigen/teichoic acid export membrane protein
LEPVPEIASAPPAHGWDRLPQCWRTAVRSDFIRKVAATYSTQLLVVFFGIITSAIIARILGPAGRGEYSVVVAWGMIGMQFGNLGLHASNIYYVAKDRKLLAPLAGNSLAVSLLAAIVFALISCALLRLRPDIVPVRGPLLVLAWIWAAASLACLLVQNLLMGVHDVSGYNKTELWKRIFSIALIVAVIVLHWITPLSIVVVSLMAIVWGLAYALWRLRKSSMGFPAPSLDLFRRTLGFGANAYLVAFFAFLVLRADLLMVNHYLGAQQAGYYSIASTLADYLLLLPAAIAAILFPKLSGIQSPQDSLRWARKSTLGAAAILLPTVAVSALAVRLVVRILFGTAYLPAVGAFLFLTPGIFFLGVETVLVQYLNSIGIPVSVVVAWVITCGVNIAVNVWAIPRFGISGASAVSSVCYALIFVFVLMIAIHQIRRLPGHAESLAA